MTLEERIQALEDQQALRELTHVYAMLAYQGRGDEMFELFTEDGTFHTTNLGYDSPPTPVRSNKKVSYTAEGERMPMVHNHIYKITGDEAEGTCVMETPFAPGRPGGFVGIYEDRFRRIDGRWYFASRHYRRLSPLE